MDRPENIHFVTGKLAASALRSEVAGLSEKLGFQATIDVLPISVAALMTPNWVARHIKVPAGTDRVILPGFCESTTELQRLLGLTVETGPKDLRRLGEHFGLATKRPDDYGAYDIEIIAEINHAPRMSLDQLLTQARQLVADGADIVDLGCNPGSIWKEIGDAVKLLTDEGIKVSVDSLEPAEISLAAAAGASLVLSVNSTNRNQAVDWGTEVVVIPDEFETLGGLEETIQHLDRHNVPFRIDPILEPIGCGFARSLQRYMTVRERYPECSMMMGVGNLTELTDSDSAGVNTLLLGICQELKIYSVLTTQVINWAQTSVREIDLARRLVHHAVKRQVPPKHLEPDLVTLRDPRPVVPEAAFLEELATQIRDHNYRIFADREQIHLLGGKRHFHHTDPFEIFDELMETDQQYLDPSHSFYLGFEMAKAMIANQLGKEYQQDQALNWGYLSVPETDRHRLKKRKRKRD